MHARFITRMYYVMEDFLHDGSCLVQQILCLTMALKIQKKISVGCLHYTNTISLKAFSISNPYFYILTGRTKLPTACAYHHSWRRKNMGKTHTHLDSSISFKTINVLKFLASFQWRAGSCPKTRLNCHVCLIRHKSQTNNHMINSKSKALKEGSNTIASIQKRGTS